MSAHIERLRLEAAKKNAEYQIANYAVGLAEKQADIDRINAEINRFKTLIDSIIRDMAALKG